MSDADRNRLVACRACGNRVARDVRRCPACGTREPTTGAPDGLAPAVAPAPSPADQLELIPAAEPSPPVGAPHAPRRSPRSRPEGSVFTPPAAGRSGHLRPPRRAARRRRRALVAMLGVLFVVTAAGMTAVYVTMPPALQPVTSEPDTVPAPVAAAPPPRAAVPAGPSRSRGHSDWLFFFKPGDWLIRMTDEALLGVVIRIEKTHAFADGSSGPAYVVQSIEGEERVLDADELERTARLR